MLTPTSTGCDPAIRVERLLRQHGMPPEEVRALCEAGDPEIARRYFELHRERLQEQLDQRMRALDILEALLTRDPGTDLRDDPHLLERGGHMPRGWQVRGQRSHVTHAELQDVSALDLDPHGAFENHEDLSG